LGWYALHTDMSATAATSQSLTPKQHRILEYLRDHADDRTYFKSRLIGDELELSAKEVGANMPAIEDADDHDLEVERWGYSSSTTWKVVA
jgi:DNA-binding MarR family transcriptional regulator